MNKNRQIEGLRGFAILCVVCYHVFYRYGEIFANSKIEFFKYFGHIGVYTFLTITIFFLIDFKSSLKIDLKNWIKKKLIRLYPQYFIAVTIIFIALNLFKLPGRTIGFIDYLLNLTFINGFIGMNYVDGAHWYLTVIIFFYFVIGILIFLKKEKEYYSYFVITIILLFINCINLFKELPIMVINYTYILIFIISFKALFLKKKGIKWLLNIFLSVIGIVYNYGIAHIVILITVFMIFLLCYLKKMKIFETKVLTYIGSISYPIYLMHQNLSYIVEYKLSSFTNDIFVIGIIGVLFSICLGKLLYEFEKKLKCYRRKV